MSTLHPTISRSRVVYLLDEEDERFRATQARSGELAALVDGD
jgi:hypothetical protein